MASNLGYLENLSTYSSYARNSKAIGILWAFFTLCYGLIGITAFLTPEWLGQEEDASSGRIGLWSVCAVVDHDREVCIGKLENFMSFPGKAFQAATVFIGLAVFSAVLTFCAMLFFLCCHSSTVFFTCGWMQLFSGNLSVSILVYPFLTLYTYIFESNTGFREFLFSCKYISMLTSNYFIYNSKSKTWIEKKLWMIHWIMNNKWTVLANHGNSVFVIILGKPDYDNFESYMRLEQISI